MGSDLIERLRAKDDRWQELCNRWQAQTEVIGATGDDIAAGFSKMRETIEAEAAAEIASLRTALATEREAREKAEKRADELRATVEAQSPIVASYIAEQSGEGKPISVLGDWLRLVAKERHRAEAAEASLAEARRLLKPFADAKGHFDGHVRDDDTVEIALRDIRARHVLDAARFLAQERGDEHADPGLSDAEQKAQGARGADDMCPCQNVPDATTRRERAGA